MLRRGRLAAEQDGGARLRRCASGDALDEIEQAFAARGSAAQVELIQPGGSRDRCSLTSRGYQLVSFENVLGRSLDGGLQPVTPPGVEVRLSDDRAAWLDVVVDGFAHPDGRVCPPTSISRARSWRRRRGHRAGWRHTVSRVQRRRRRRWRGMRITEGVAQLAGAATAPAHRRRGVQTALLSARLADAAAPAATSPSSRPRRVRNRSRTCSAEAFTCSTPVRCW